MHKSAGLIGALLLALPAGTEELVSGYTDLRTNTCTMLDSEMGEVATCPGLNGYPVMIAAGDMRMFVSFGLDPVSEIAARQSLPPVNRIGGKLEWLLPAEDQTAPPIATILRWKVQPEQAGPEAEVLVVTQLVPGATCHIAYVDALANGNANQLARQAAEELAGDFDCAGTMPRIYGTFEAFDLE
jgi:hypothetical protein